MSPVTTSEREDSCKTVLLLVSLWPNRTACRRLPSRLNPPVGDRASKTSVCVGICPENRVLQNELKDSGSICSAICAIVSTVAIAFRPEKCCWRTGSPKK
jgi:hypothetical protein